MANIPYTQIQVFPVSNIPSVYRFGLTTEQNMTDTFRAMCELKLIDGTTNDGYVVSYTNNVLTAVVSGYFVKIKDPTNYIASSSNRLFINLNISHGAKEGSLASEIALGDGFPATLNGISVDSSISGDYNVHLFALEKVNGVWTVPEKTKVIFGADRLGGDIDCGAFSTDTFGESLQFVNREYTFGED